ncbi:MAG: bacillithiol biosynthesis cysteine-adding enzyme BshC [Candidatus Kapabacteria bacterium]|nr:bacillithiol biosynthesis cysteine-adding enzyme BshC [Candidatus Kapabacteria bacterium]
MTILPTETIVTTPITRAYLDRDPAITDRFQRLSVDAEFCLQRSKHGASRSRLVDLATASMRGLELSSEQRSALDVLRNPTSVVVTTGQQIGLYGGPMYTLYKIRTAVEEARRLTASTAVPAATVFWLEDNDHDAAEAASTHLLAADGGVTDLNIWDGSDERRSVSARVITGQMADMVEAGAATFTGHFADVTRQRMLDAYAVGRSWSDAFLAVLQPYLAPWGVIVVRGSDVIASGLHLPILMRETEAPGSLSAATTAGTQVLLERGFTAQATTGSMLFFGSDSNGRQRCSIEGDTVTMGSEKFTTLAFAKLVQEHPERFTPNVLARPVVQDAVLPTVISVLGSAEIAYQAQLRELYELCGVPMPYLVLRNGATLLDARTERLLAKDGHPLSWFMRSSEDVERATADLLTSDVLPNTEERNATLETLLAPYLTAAQSIDQTLIATVRAQGAGITATLEALEGKLRAAAKRAGAQTMDRIKAIHSIVMPRGTLQERNFPLGFWESRFGTAELRIIAEAIASQPIGTHVVMGHSDLSTREPA